MQGDAVHAYHWMSNSEFLNAVALGQVTPGPVVATVAAVGYGAYGIPGGLLAALVAFLPSFSFILLGGAASSGCAATGSPAPSSPAPARRRSARSSAPRSRSPPPSPAAGSTPCSPRPRSPLLVLRRGVVSVLLAAGAVGAVVALAGGPLP